MASILIIDDDVELRAMLREALTAVGHQVCEARDGREGLAQFRAHPADLVISNIFMPEQNGLEVIRALHQAWPQLPILAISGGIPATPYDFLPIAAHLGARRTLQKPFTLQQLYTAVEELLQGVSGADQPSRRAQPAEEVPTTEEPSAHLLATSPILVVDDDLLVTQLVVDTLTFGGYSTEIAMNGLVALEKLRERPYRFIISNMHMPGLDGLGLFHVVERQYPYLRQRFIFITGGMLSPEIQGALAAAGVPYLKKPFGIGDLLAQVRQVLTAAEPSPQASDAPKNV